MKMTLGQAALHSGFSKPTLSRAIKSGKLSAHRLEDGSYAVDPAELERWIDGNGHRNSQMKRIATPAETPETPLNDSALQVEVKMLREMLATLSGERDRERSQLQSQIEDLRNSVRLLENHSGKGEDLKDKQKRGWWAFAKGKAA
jgi:hypothetical protein